MWWRRLILERSTSRVPFRPVTRKPMGRGCTRRTTAITHWPRCRRRGRRRWAVVIECTVIHSRGDAVRDTVWDAVGNALRRTTGKPRFRGTIWWTFAKWDRLGPGSSPENSVIFLVDIQSSQGFQHWRDDLVACWRYPTIRTRRGGLRLRGGG